MSILDQFGRPIENFKKRPETRDIAATVIRDRWSTYPSQGLTPQKLATIFKEADGGDVYRQAELFEEMEEKDTHLFSEFQTRKNAVLGLDYDIQPYSNSAQDKRIAEFSADCIFSIKRFEDALRDLLDALGKGYSLMEIKWVIDGQRAIIEDLDWIHAKKAIFYDRGRGGMGWDRSDEIPRILTEAEPYRGEEMPPFKLVYHRYKARSGYDTRAGILRTCAWMYLFKNYSIKDWVAFAEVFGMPLRLGKYDPGASKDDKDALVAAIQSLGSDAAGIISKNTEIDFIESMKGSTRENIFQTLADFCNKEMSKAILGQTATTEGTPGKLGNETAQDKVRQDLIEADAEALANAIRFQIIRPLVGYNFGWDTPLPWFKIMYEPPEDLEKVANVYEKLHAINYPLTMEHVSERFKVPLPEKGQTILEGPAASPFAMKRTMTRIAAKSGDPASGDITDARIANELIIEKERQKFVGGYLATLSQIEGDVRADALERVVMMLEGGGALTEAQFCEKVYGILETAYADLDRAAIREPLEDCYSFYRLKDTDLWGGDARGLGFTWGTRDERTLDFIANIDRFHLGKFIRNDDMKGPVWTFLKEQYGEHGAALYGRTSPEVLAQFRDLFSDRLGDLTDMQIRRICDTSVARMRGYGTVEQLHEAGVEYAKVVAVLDSRTSAICAEMDGKVIPVAGMYDTVTRETAMTPEDYIAYLKTETPTLTRAEGGEAIPPYHPHCRTRLVYAYEEAV